METSLAKGNRHGEYVVKGTGPKSTTDLLVKIISPTASVIERARALVKGTIKRKLTQQQQPTKDIKNQKFQEKRKNRRTLKNRSIQKQFELKYLIKRREVCSRKTIKEDD